MKSIIKNIWFVSHKTGMIVIPYLWILYPNIKWLYLVTILSWNLNNNKCLITQLEYYLFGSTFLGNGKKFLVPIRHRIILYINFLFALIYQRMN